MAYEREIKLLIRADGSVAITGIKSVGDEVERFQGRTMTMTESLKKNWLAVTAGITAAYFALQKMWSWMEQAAELEERMETLERLTRQYGMTAEDVTGGVSRMSRGLIGVKDAAQVATDALMKGFTPEQVMQMASWAVTLHKTSAEAMTSAEAFRTLEQSITAARERGTVRLLGATIDLKTALGDQAEKMSKAEKALAMYVLVAERMEKVQRAIGKESDSAADRMQRFSNSIEMMKRDIGSILLLIGGPLMAIINIFMGAFYKLVAAMAEAISQLGKLTDKFKLTEGMSERFHIMALAAGAKAKAAGESAWANLKGTIDRIFSATTPGLPGAPGGMPSLADTLRKDTYEADGAMTLRSKIIARIQAETIKVEQAAFESRLALHRAELGAERTRLDELQKAMESRLGIFRYENEERNRLTLERLKLALEAKEQEIQMMQQMERDLLSRSGETPGMRELGAGMFGLVSMAAGKDPYSLELERRRLFWEQMIELERQGKATLQELETAHQSYVVMLEQQTNMQRLQQAQMYAQVAMGLVNLASTFTGNKSKALFLATRAIMAAMSIISGHAAAMAALAPPPLGLGPVIGAPLAAAMKALGYINAAAIMATAFMGMSSGGGGSIPSVGGGGVSAPAAMAPIVEERPYQPIVNVYVYGSVVDHDAFAREIIPSIAKAVEDGVR